MTFARSRIGPGWALALVALLSLIAVTALPLLAQGGFPAVVLQNAVPGFEQPLFVDHAGDGSGRLFVVEQRGRVRIVSNGQLVPSPFIDISDRVLSGGERGLLGLAFAPDYATSGYFYLYYTSNLDDGDGPGDITISRFSRGSNAGQANPASELELLTIEHTARSNHNGGMLAFGPRDGYLYIGTGDGGGSNDPDKNAQNPASLLGKLLRIDVGGRAILPQPAQSSCRLRRRFMPIVQRAPGSGQSEDSAEPQPPISERMQAPAPAQLPYAIPPGNPFVGRAGYRAEIWALGLRNPWRMSFDRQTGDLFIGDVGQGRWEEVNCEAEGGAGGINYGWPALEGPECNAAVGASCNRSGFTEPINAYGRAEGGSITGGYVYRGTQAPALSGLYVFGDFISGQIWGLRRDASGSWVRGVLLKSTASIASFGEDQAGELYLLDYSGTLYRVGTN